MSLFDYVKDRTVLITGTSYNAVIEAMAYVDQLDADPKQTLLDLQYGSLESRNSWTEAAKQADYGPAYASALPETNLKSEMTTLKNGGAKTDQMYERIKAVDVRIAKDFVVTNEEHTGRFIGMWKACSQSAHMGGDKILKLMCINNASEGVDVVPGRDPDIQILKEQVSACIAALGLVSIRVDSLISS